MNEPFSYTESHRRYVEARRADPRSNEELIQTALAAEDDEAYWEATAVLWYRPHNQVRAISQLLLGGDNVKERILGAHVLGQGGSRERMPADESLPLLLALLEVEQDGEVLGAIGYALGQIGDLRAIAPLTPLKNHPDAHVRYGVVQGLLGHNDDRAIATLTELSADPDVDVRNWATFGLVLVEEVDTPTIRAALWDRVTDENDEVRAEALEGLALREDRGVVEPLVRELAAVEDEMWPPLYRAAVAAGKRLGDPRLHGALVQLRSFRGGDVDEELEEAIKNSEPAAVE